MSHWELLQEDFEQGEVVCECGNTFHLEFNEGKLDYYQCSCGLEYKQESIGYNLIVKSIG